MENTLKRMVDRIYQEGISRAEDRSRQIVTAAETRAKEITAKARREAEEIVRQARAEAEKLLKTADSDLRLLGSRALSQLKNEIGSLVTAKAVAQPLASAASDAPFMLLPQTPPGPDFFHPGSLR